MRRRRDYNVAMPQLPMLVIRQAQLDAFEGRALADLADRLEPIIAERHPDVADEWLPQALYEEVLRRARVARRLGLDTVESVADFVDLTFQIGACFHEHPLVQSVLADRRIEPRRRILELVGQLTPSDWDDVRAFCDNASESPGEAVT